MNVLALFKPIDVFVFDVDGVMTDGTLQVLGNGELSRQMNIKDGYALQLAVKKGYRVAVISGGKSPGVVKRLQRLGITDVFTGVGGKSEVLDAYLAKYAIPPEKILYMGDDMPDLAAMKRVGLPACPADAVPEIKAICRYISFAVGGRGCVRDVIEKVLKLNGHWE